MTGIILPLAAFLLAILLLSIFFSKENINNFETKVYSKILILNFVYSFLAVFAFLCSRFGINDFFIGLLQKLYMSNMILIIMYMIIYNVFILKINEHFNLIVRRCIYFVTSLIVLATFITPITVVNTEEMLDGYGLSYDIVLISTIIYFVLIIISSINIFIKNKNNIKKDMPFLVLIVLFIAGFILREFLPSVMFENFFFSYVLLIMYHTIENPDIKMIEQLNAAKTTAEKANRAKSDFLSSMSHEIRTPLNAIVGFSECIKSADNLDEAKENANDVITASQTLLEIVNGILDISKIESGKLELVETDYDTRKLFKDIQKLIIARIGDKQLDFKVSIAEDIPNALYGDHFNIKKILINLLTNAVKYTDSGYVNLNIKCVKNNNICRLIISVKDSGRGIKKENIDKLFTKFNRLDEDRNTTIEGTGLGLAITKQLVDMMGGKIVVNSVYGEGSEFTVAIDQKLSDKIIETEQEEEIDFLDLTGKKILLVDDNKLNLKVAQKLLMPYHPVIDICETGFECLDKIKLGNNYDLILMDDMMPKMRGPEVLNKLKEDKTFNTPVIALTANAINGIKEQYINMGFNDYLAKPIDKHDLHDILSKFLSKKVIESEKKTKNKEVNTNDKKILIVDDNKLNIKIAIHAMKDYNFNIEEAYSGKECIEKVKNNQYDLIFMDYMMPEIDGIATLNNLKQLPNFKTPVIALTADAIDGARERFLEAGFDEYVAKPINQGFLNDAIVNVIESKMNINLNTKGNITYLKDNGINIDKGISILGNIGLYNDTLGYFLESIQERLVKLNNWKTQNNLKNYAIEVNALKSDCNYLGFTELLKITTIHENEANNNNLEYINNNYQVLINEIIRLVNVARKYL